MQFTRSEFDAMVQQLLYDEKVSFDMLCHIAEKTLRHSVSKWCREDSSLTDKEESENDIMQDVHLRLIKRTVTHFLLRGDVGTINDDPEGFEDWMFKVAKNIKKDYANAIRKRNARTDGTDPDGLAGFVDPGTEINLSGVEKLHQAAVTVMEARAGIYKILTWLAQAIVIVSGNVTKMESNEILLRFFENKTLNEMYGFVCKRSEGLPWLDISEKHRASMEAALDKQWRDGVTYGNARYRDFFMKKDGVPCGKKSISDWVNRMNDLIKRKMHDKMKSSPDAENGAEGKEA